MTSRHADKRRSANSPTSRRTPQTASTSFFIIQEPGRDEGGSPSGSASPPASVSRSSKPAAADNQALVATRSLSRTRAAPASAFDALDEHEELKLEPESRKQNAPKPVLSLMNRCGSAPDLPLHNNLSTMVYSSSKKRALIKSSGLHGTGPHLMALQRSRLTPLPINIRTGTMRRDDPDWQPKPAAASSAPTIESQKQAEADDMIASLRQRLTQMEKELARRLKEAHVLTAQSDQLRKENQAVTAERMQLHNQIQVLETTVRQQKNAFEKLSDRYATVYTNLQTLVDQQQADASALDSSPALNQSANHIASMQIILQTLTRENQELHRKLRVLETRHSEDKGLASTQEKKLKRLRAEIEALQHLNDANAREDAGGEPQSDSPSGPPKAAKPQASTSPSSASATNSSSSIDSTNGHLISALDYQFIDPNILKVLEKVDSQFSITNAIHLSVVLKKWLHSCMNVVGSTQLSTVLQTLLGRACELLHCDHAAIFLVDHAARKLVGVYSERGNVHWELPLDKGILGHAVRYNQICNVRKAYEDPRFYSATDTVTATHSREVLCVPIVQELELTMAQGSNTGSVFAVLQAWNTTHQKPFTPNDQILAGLLTTQAGIIVLQTKVAKTLQRVNKQLLQILRLPEKIASKAVISASSGSPGSPSPSPSSSVSLVHLVGMAQKRLSSIIGIQQLRLYLLDADIMKIWHVGSEHDANGDLMLVRKYANVASSLCGLILDESKGITLLDPVAEATFNDTVDLKGGSRGLYLVPISSPWTSVPFGMIQAARSAVSSSVAAVNAGLSYSDPAAAIVSAKETQQQQRTNDLLVMELLELFSRVFSGLLAHARALEAYDACPVEIRQARLAYLVDRMEWLEMEFRDEQDQAETDEALAKQHTQVAMEMEQRIFEAMQREKLPSRSGSRPPGIPGIMTEVVTNEAARRSSFVNVQELIPRAETPDVKRALSAGSTRSSDVNLLALSLSRPSSPSSPDQQTANMESSCGQAGAVDEDLQLTLQVEDQLAFDAEDNRSTGDEGSTDTGNDWDNFPTQSSDEAGDDSESSPPDSMDPSASEDLLSRDSMYAIDLGGGSDGSSVSDSPRLEQEDDLQEEATGEL